MAKTPPPSGMTRLSPSVLNLLKVYRKELTTYCRTVRKAAGLADVAENCSTSTLIGFAVGAAVEAIRTGTH